MTDQFDAPTTQPLRGMRVALVHPAWHSCGTYQVVLGQIEAYRALGAAVYPIAISSDPGFIPERAWLWRAFVAATPELDANARFFGGAPFHAVLAPRFLKNTLWPYLHGDQAAIRLGMAERATLSRALSAQSFDLVHCNHFFLMPVAHRLAHSPTPILLDTHDLQARQFVLINKGMPWLKPRVEYQAMLAQELEAMRGASLLLHLNAQEAQDFRALLPQMSHELLYPATPPAPTGPGGPDIIIVASNNTANVESVIWFLREVAPQIANLSIKIIGNVDAGVRAQAPQEFAAYQHWFLGRVDDPGRVYANARLVLLPTISGHGLSIKTIEAFSSGLPIIATPHALRGMGAQVGDLEGLTIADTAKTFSDAITAQTQGSAPKEAQRLASQTRGYYLAQFSQRAYEKRLAALIARLPARVNTP